MIFSILNYVRLRGCKANLSMKHIDNFPCVLFHLLYYFGVCNLYRLTAFDVLIVYVSCNYRKHVLKQQYRFSILELQGTNQNNPVLLSLKAK